MTGQSTEKRYLNMTREKFYILHECKCVLNQYKLDASPTPSDEEDMSSDEEDAFGPKKAEKVEEDPVKSKDHIFK